MTLAAVEWKAARARLIGEPKRLIFWSALTAVVIVSIFIPNLLPWADEYPKSWVVPFRGWAGDSMNWMVKELDFGLFTFLEATRGFAWLLGWPFDFTNWLLWEGFEISKQKTFSGLPWFALVGCVTIMSYAIAGWRLALLSGGCFLYLVVFGHWNSAMMTVSSLLLAVPIGCVLGLLVGSVAYRHRHVEAAITPLLDFMQTVPVFAYLVPVIMLFSFGPVPALIVMVIYATPPMVRATILGFKLVSPEIVEFGRMTGCSPRQLTWKVMIPSARPTLMVGVNQVIMLSLNAVIIASVIGAGGLGFDVFMSLKQLKIGQGLEVGVAIVLLAIAMDRITRGFLTKPPPSHAVAKTSFLRRHPYFVACMALIIGSLILANLVPAASVYPKSWTVTTGRFWDDLIMWITVNLYDYLYAVRAFLLVNILLPVKRFLLEVPWITLVLIIGALGWRLGGWRVATLVSGLVLLIATTGFWDKAVNTVYLMSISVLIAMIMGVPLGIWAGHSERAHRIFEVINDTLQTLPSFVYLMPVVMLFQVGDVSGMFAVIAYAIAPVIRYTDHGLRHVPRDLIEAARTAGCTKRQLFWKVEFPLAFPEILLGINQTVMLAISMLVITALVGTTDLGQEVFIGLSNADPGRAIVAGICVAFIAITADRLIQGWARKRKAQLGIS